MPPASADDFNFNDDEMQRVLAMSRQEAGIADENEIVDPDLLAAIEESRRMLEDGNDQPNAANAPAVDEIGLDDPELLEAIRASLETHDDDGATNNNNNEEVDPDFEEALRLSNEINVDDDDDEPQNEKGKEEKKDESKEEKKKESEIDKKLEEDINSLIDSPDALQSILSEFGDIGDTKKDEEPKKQ
ncbi:hypothetical protein TRFO_11737 [Tritrichomonas foetus]|uniref:Uncharacterized protein n=1 Tax=Tritrichomonas foetus TaxID=1144522 RepID=A0A1J4J214_9EUKA|nr:hypothetical protein TRFO_11737 [Tritrichomonas foetus]|eukprot:OHS93528.1 hypothetical protein TRFO_11737 [Tritrichomonas foetus]